MFSADEVGPHDTSIGVRSRFGAEDGAVIQALREVAHGLGPPSGCGNR